MVRRPTGLAVLPTRFVALLKHADLMIASVFILSSTLRWLTPAYVIPNSGKDDYLGVLLAHNLLQGNWLGTWTPDTLVKPPAYSFFLVVAHFFPVDPTFILHILYLSISLLFIYSLRGLSSLTQTNYRLFANALFMIFAFNPAVFANSFSRVYRQSLSTILALLFFTLILRLSLFLKRSFLDNGSVGWKKTKLKNYWKLSLCIGLTYAASILTRSEAYWVLVGSVPFLISIWLLAINQTSFSWLSTRKYASGTLLMKVSSIAIISFLIPIGLVSSLNKSYYGVSEVENFYSGNFARAIKLWEGVETGKSNIISVPVSVAQRAAIYPVSPAAQSMRAVLDGPPDTGWKTANCQRTQICNESGAWFPWELRDAAVASNNISNELQFQEFFGTLADQISAACETGVVVCNSTGLALGAKPIKDYPLRQLIDISLRAFSSLLTVNQASNVRYANNDGDEATMAIWHSTVNFRHLSIKDELKNWEGMANSITFLRNLYQVLLPVLFLFALISLLNHPRFTNRILKYYQIGVITSMMVFATGTGIFYSGLGFADDFNLYGLPMQPLLLIFISTGVLQLLESTNKEFK
jgi:hypothetical protein